MTRHLVKIVKDNRQWKVTIPKDLIWEAGLRDVSHVFLYAEDCSRVVMTPATFYSPDDEKGVKTCKISIKK